MSDTEIAEMIRDRFGGEGVQAVLAVARVSGVAVAYQDRSTFEAHLDRPLSEEEWGRLAPHRESYDEWLDRSGGAESIEEWRFQVLRKAGVDGHDE